MSRSSQQSLPFIYQALHGYSEGHTLLSSSLNLEPADRRKMMIMSDLSGPSFVSGFESYVQGYSLPTLKAFVLARTWPAEEMPRPGCVWTHSLIIPATQLSAVSDLKVLKNFFRRPSLEAGFKEYQNFIKFEDLFPKEAKSFTNFHLRFFEKYFNPSSNQLVLLADSNQTFEDDILSCWNLVWSSLKPSIELSSGILGARETESGTFLVGIAPRSTRRLLERNSGISLISQEDLQKNVSSPKGFDSDITVSDLTALSNFTEKFGKDIAPNRTLEPKVLKLSKVLYQGVNNLEEFLGDLISISADGPQNDLIRKVLDRDVELFPGLRTISESAILYFALTKLPSEQRAAVANDIPVRVSHLLRNSATEAFWLLTSLSQSDPCGELCLDVSTNLYVGLLKQNVLEKIPIRDDVVIRAFTSNPELWANADALKNLARHSRIFDQVLESAKLDGPEKLKAASLAIKILGPDGTNLAFRLMDDLPFDDLIRMVISSSNRIDLRSPQYRQILGRRRNDFVHWLSHQNQIPKVILQAFLDVADINNDTDSDLVSRVVSKSLLNREPISELPQEAVCFTLGRSLKRSINDWQQLIEALFQPVYLTASANRLSQQSINFLSATTVKLYFWNGRDHCARLRISLLDLLRDGEIHPMAFVRACRGRDLLKEVLREGENYLFTDRRVIKQRLKQLLKSPEDVPRGTVDIIEKYVDEKFGW